MTTMTLQGETAPGFDGIRDIFEENLMSRDELGAAVSAWYRGKPIVDLWGGYRDRNREKLWTQDTQVLVFSATKGISALCMAWLHTKGYLDYDERVSTYWPEFAENGKADVTVEELMNHRAGLAIIDRSITPKLLADRDAFGEVLARQKPRFQGQYAYHAQSIGWYQSQLAKRVDPKGRYLSELFEHEIQGPMGLEFCMSHPKSPAFPIAELKDFTPWSLWLRRSEMSYRLSFALLLPMSRTSKAMKNPNLGRPCGMMREPWCYQEMPASNGYTTARGLAKAYQVLAAPDAFPLLSDATRQILKKPPVQGPDRVLFADVSYQYGFMRPNRKWQFGLSSDALGFAGLGGSFAFACPASGLSYAYTPNRLGLMLWNDPRERALRETITQKIQSLM